MADYALESLGEDPHTVCVCVCVCVCVFVFVRLQVIMRGREGHYSEYPLTHTTEKLSHTHMKCSHTHY